MSFIKFNTIDLDGTKIFPMNKDSAQRIIDKICLCKNLIKIQLKPSCSKGYHVLMLCSKDCDLCRLLYDDQKRFSIDLNIRKPEFRNLLWDKKEPLVKQYVYLKWRVKA
jgi:hypothetical protein